MPTKRNILHLDTGTIEMKATGEETVEERFASMRAEAIRRGAGAGSETMSVMCDSCGSIKRVSEPALPEGWTTNERGEFCPRCAPSG
jgi:hypothetical protein